MTWRDWATSLGIVMSLWALVALAVVAAERWRRGRR